MELGLRGKAAVITGGSVGIGLAIAQGLAAEGVDLVLVARDAARLDREAEGIRSAHGVRVVTVACDVSEAEAATLVTEAAATHFDGADILINNAGTGSNETIMEAPDSKWDFYWNLHVMAAVRLARGLVPSMKKRGGGVILHNASICASQPLGYEPIYNVTKAALVMFSKNLANEVVSDNIRVNTVNPGLVLTPDWVKTAKELTAGTGGDWEGHLQAVADEYAPIRRFASPEEIANLFVFLCSDRASYCVGSAFFADGGMLRTI
jgi:NAD(P)-dependent dehydrogenase (short-subunit alcohol dehydrogenase family)